MFNAVSDLVVKLAGEEKVTEVRGDELGIHAPFVKKLGLLLLSWRDMFAAYVFFLLVFFQSTSALLTGSISDLMQDEDVSTYCNL